MIPLYAISMNTPAPTIITDDTNTMAGAGRKQPNNTPAPKANMLNPTAFRLQNIKITPFVCSLCKKA
jgi:hypothetical protein